MSGEFLSATVGDRPDWDAKLMACLRLPHIHPVRDGRRACVYLGYVRGTGSCYFEHEPVPRTYPYYHRVLKPMVDPLRPWRRLHWIRVVDFYHACQYVQQLADTICGAGAEAQSWAKEMRHGLKTKADGVSRVLKSASALRRSRGLCGQVTLYDSAYRSIKKRTQWMRYHLYKRQHESMEMLGASAHA